MKLPIRRHDDGADREFEQLRAPFVEQMERWPDFVRPLHGDASTSPLVDVEETDDAYLLDVELPGVKRGDVDLQVDAESRLLLSAERRERERVGLLRHRTRSTGRLALALTLPGPVDSERVTATLDDGVLSVVVPKPAGARRRRISVSHRR